MLVQDKVIWLTGASSGIGESLAWHLAEKGAKLILSSRKKDELERVRSRAENENIHILPLDLSDSAALEEVTKKALAIFGKIDILINNGGISQRALAKDTLLEVDRKIMEVNYFGTIAITKFLLPHFIQKDQGQYVVISSLVGKFGTPYRSGYSASKHALHGFFDSLRAEISKNIKVTIVCPGFIKTNVSINALTENGEKLNKMDEAQAKGMSADVCAQKIIKALETDREEVYIGGKEKYMAYLKRFFPKYFSGFVKRIKVR